MSENQHPWQIDDRDLSEQWDRLQHKLRARFGKNFGLEGILFLMGLQSRGLGYTPKMGKEDKQDTIMEGTFRALESLGLYLWAGIDSDGANHWQRTEVFLPKLPIDEQEKLLKLGAIQYLTRLFEEISE